MYTVFPIFSLVRGGWSGAGTVRVTVTTPNGTSSQDVTFSYDVPVRLSVALSKAQATVTLSAG